MFTDNLKFHFCGDSVTPDFPMRGFTIMFKNNYSSKYFCLNFTRVLVICNEIDLVRVKDWHLQNYET